MCLMVIHFGGLNLISITFQNNGAFYLQKTKFFWGVEWIYWERLLVLDIKVGIKANKCIVRMDVYV